MIDPDARDRRSDIEVDVDAALWALGSPDAPPRVASAELVAEIATLREAAALLVLGLDAVAPDARIWPRLDAAIGAPREVQPAVSALEIARARRRARVAYAVAALGLASAAIFTALWSGARSEAAHSRFRLGLAHAESARLTAPLRSPDLEMTTVRGSDGGVAQILTARGGRRWLVIALDLPQVPQHDYQLWFVPENGPPVSAGLLRVAGDGTFDATATVPSTIGRVRPAISLEPAGGSVTPTTVKMVGEII
jgi:hypothetical protein